MFSTDVMYQDASLKKIENLKLCTFYFVHAVVDPQSREAKALSLTCCAFSSDMMYQDPSFEKSSWNLTLLLFEFMDGQLRELNRKYRRIS